MTTKVVDCDILVLGAEGSGLVAAVKAADVSGKKVIVLEKPKKPGGGSIFFASGIRLGIYSRRQCGELPEKSLIYRW